MNTYKDTTYCSKECNNTECVRNSKNIPENVGMLVCYSDFDNCKEWRDEDE